MADANLPAPLLSGGQMLIYRDGPISQTSFATVQNKLHWAIHGHTAAEIIHGRTDAGKPKETP